MVAYLANRLLVNPPQSAPQHNNAVGWLCQSSCLPPACLHLHACIAALPQPDSLMPLFWSWMRVCTWQLIGPTAQLPCRPGFGTAGKGVKILANYFKVCFERWAAAGEAYILSMGQREWFA